MDVSVCDEAGNEVPCLSVAVRGLGTEVCMHPWDLGVRASLGSLSVQMMNHGPGGGHLDIVTTPQGAQLLSVSYVKVSSGFLSKKRIFDLMRVPRFDLLLV